MFQPISLYFIFYFLLFSACTYSQIEPSSSDRPPPEKVNLLAIRQHKAQGYSFYDYDGNLKFSLPFHHAPALTPEGEHDSDEHFHVVDFSYGVIPVMTSEGFYIVDGNGKYSALIMGKYHYVGSFQNGYMRTSSLTEYYNVKGERSFGTGQYSQGGPIINETALVRLYEKNKTFHDQKGDWVLLDVKGNIIHNISDQVEGEIHGLQESRVDNMWLLSVDGPQKRTLILVTPAGKIITDVRGIESAETQLHRKLYMLADSNATANNYPNKKMLRYWLQTVVDGKLYFIGDKGLGPEKKFFVIDQFQNEIPLEMNGNYIDPLQFIDEYVLTEEKKDNKVIAYRLFNLKTNQFSALLPDRPEIVDRLFTYNVDFSPQTIIEKVIDGEGKVIYEIDPANRYVTNTRNALANPAKTKILYLDNPRIEQLETLKNLPAVEIFELHHYTYDRLPEQIFSGWNNVHYIKLDYCKELIALPESMKELKNLSFLEIRNCRKLEDTGLEVWLEYWPSLKKVKTDYPFSNEIIKKYPAIHFESEIQVITID